MWLFDRASFFGGVGVAAALAVEYLLEEWQNARASIAVASLRFLCSCSPSPQGEEMYGLLDRLTFLQVFPNQETSALFLTRYLVLQIYTQRLYTLFALHIDRLLLALKHQRASHKSRSPIESIPGASVDIFSTTATASTNHIQQSISIRPPTNRTPISKTHPRELNVYIDTTIVTYTLATPLQVPTMAPPTPTNASSRETPYFTPSHLQTPGSATTLTPSTPTLFTPLTIRSITLRNRILVAPMCQYSTSPFPTPQPFATPTTTTTTTGTSISPSNTELAPAPAGALTPYHLTTLGHYALKGASLIFIEATAVQPRGRISPNCPGLWSDAHIPAIRAVAQFVRSQGGVMGLQLAHAGRKASVVPPWVSGARRRAMGLKGGSLRASDEEGGWEGDVVGPMGGASETWDGLRPEERGSGYCAPRALSEEEIKELVSDWGRAARRAIAAGVQVVEIHAAHGYLLHQFLSPVTNRRTDGYGGSWENRTRLLREVVAEVRRNIPAELPLFLRVSATEWLEGTDVEKTIGRGHSWGVEDTVRLAGQLEGWGVDLLDVSSGGNHPGQRVDMFQSKDYQVKIAKRLRREVKMKRGKLLIGAVGLITAAEQARGIVELGAARGGIGGGGEEEGEAREVGVSVKEEAEAAVAMTERKQEEDDDGGEPMADVILVARQFMREPEWVLRVAHELGVDVAWPNQFLRVRFPKL